MLKFAFEVPLEEIQRDLDVYVSSVFSCLESEFLVLPKGSGFVEYPTFERGYEALKAGTSGFEELAPERVLPVTHTKPMAIVVLRSMLGFTPPEWAYITTQKTGVQVTQGFARSLDRRIRLEPEAALKVSASSELRLKALVETACGLLTAGAPEMEPARIHRLDKADTQSGAVSIRRLAGMGVPYAMLLYERLLGRPFAGHRDSVSELVGDPLESAIEDVLTNRGVSFRKTKRAERIEGLDQTPDFIVPSEFNPQAVVEAKITEDDGTARDKVTRIQHLAELSTAGQPPGHPRFEVIACIGGRGFGVRREDMKKMLLATRGKVFTLKTIDKLVSCTRLREFATK